MFNNGPRNILNAAKEINSCPCFVPTGFNRNTEMKKSQLMEYPTLRTVPPNTDDHGGKVDLSKGYWNPFFRDN